MRAFVLLFLAGWVLASSPVSRGAADADAVKQEREKLKGTWQVTSYDLDGKKLPDEQVKATKVMVDATGKLTVQREGKTTIEGATEIDPTKKPKTIAIKYTKGERAGQTVQGIYEINGDDYRVCFALPGKERPTEFASKPGSGHILIAYKRAKAE